MSSTILQLGSLYDLAYHFVFGIVVPILALAWLWDVHDQARRQTEQLERIESHFSEMASDDDENGS